MSPRQFGKLDNSVTAPGWDCPRCLRKHMPGSVCPPIGVWLVLTLCWRCDAKTETYCTRHRDRRIPLVPPEGMSLIGPDEQAEVLRRYEGDDR